MASQAAQLSFRVLDNFLSHLYNSTSRLNAFKKLASYYSSKQPLERIYKLASSSEADLRGAGSWGSWSPQKNSERVKKLWTFSKNWSSLFKIYVYSNLNKTSNGHSALIPACCEHYALRSVQAIVAARCLFRPNQKKSLFPGREATDFLRIG